MINIQDSRIIKYDGDRKSVTVYRDYSNTNLWYIVPKPQLATQTVDGMTLPAFSLTEFKTTDVDSAGTVAFTVELVIDKDDYQAARSALGPNIEFGQFTWTDSQVFLTPKLPSITEGTQLNVTPSNYGGNSATFIINLKDTDDVNAVRSIFDTKAGLSTWSIQYVASTLCQLPAVKATVTYDCKIAASYQKSVHIDRNVWGSETGRRTTIREYMKKSDSGDVKLDWATTPSDELRQRVHDWAFTTLEGLVQAAADDVARRLGSSAADDFNIESIGSFKRVYEENQIADWTIMPQGFLPTFEKDVWSRLDKIVDNRTLAVSIVMKNDLKKAGIKQVLVTIDYPSKAQPTIYTFTPDGPTSFTYDANGAFIDHVFDPTYTYWYKVDFEDGHSFETPHRQDKATTLELTYTDLGYQTVEFSCQNVDFASSKPDGKVDFILIDFSYRPNETAKLYIDQQRVDRQDQKVVFRNYSYMEGSASYIFAVTYVLTDKTVIVDRPTSVLGVQNSHSRIITSAIGESEFTVTALSDSNASSSITGVSLKGTYTDKPGAAPQRHTYQNLRIDEEYTGTATYVGLVNNDYATVQFDGFVVCKIDGKSRQVQIRSVRYSPDSTWTMLLQSVEVPFTVTFDPALIDWNAYSSVLVNVFRSKKEFRLKNPAAVPDKDKIDDLSIPFNKPNTAISDITVPASYYYTFAREVGAPDEIYYSATYYDPKGTPSYVHETSYDGTTVILPAHALSSVPVLQIAALPATDVIAIDVDTAQLA